MNDIRILRHAATGYVEKVFELLAGDTATSLGDVVGDAERCSAQLLCVATFASSFQPVGDRVQLVANATRAVPDLKIFEAEFSDSL